MERLLAIAGTSKGKPAILVREIATGKLLQTLLGHEGRITSVAFSSDSARIVSGSDDRTSRLWEIGRPYAEQYFKGSSEAQTPNLPHRLVHASLDFSE